MRNQPGISRKTISFATTKENSLYLENTNPNIHLLQQSIVAQNIKDPS